MIVVFMFFMRYSRCFGFNWSQDEGGSYCDDNDNENDDNCTGGLVLFSDKNYDNDNDNDNDNN